MTNPKKKPAKKAREWRAWVYLKQPDVLSTFPPPGGYAEWITVREVLPRVRKKTTKGKKK
jgi:hypothetical protein